MQKCKGSAEPGVEQKLTINSLDLKSCGTAKLNTTPTLNKGGKVLSLILALPLLFNGHDVRLSIF